MAFNVGNRKLHDINGFVMSATPMPNRAQTQSISGNSTVLNVDTREEDGYHADKGLRWQL